MGYENKLLDIWTIGHSTRTLEIFIEMLASFDIQLVVDVRHFPGSRRYPHFNKGSLEQSLPSSGIQYVHMIELGGRRKPRPDSTNTVWRHPAFRGYADYMETAQFKNAAAELMEMAREKRLAYMCSEAVWWRCHRRLISEYLQQHGWSVMNIMDVGKATPHPSS